MIDFNKPKIDSFTLLIPIENITVINSTFLVKYVKVYECTGEIENSESFYNTYRKTENKEKCTFLKYSRVQRLFNGINREFIQIMFTSKLLCERYFEGINSENINVIYDYIINDKIISISINDFLNSAITDIDICKDYAINLEQFKSLKTSLIGNVLPSKQKYIESKRINSVVTFGIQYNERQKAKPTSPFIKLYYKTMELNTEKTKPFKDKNLQEYESVINNGIARMEITIKNYKHKERLNIKEIKSLNDLLKLNIDDLNRLHSDCVSEYYKGKIIMKKESQELTPTEYVSQGLLNRIYKLDHTITKEQIIFDCINEIDCKYKKTKAKKIIIDAINLNQNKTNILKNSDQQKTVIDVMKNLGIFED